MGFKEECIATHKEAVECDCLHEPFKCGDIKQVCSVPLFLHFFKIIQTDSLWKFAHSMREVSPLNVSCGGTSQIWVWFRPNRLSHKSAKSKLYRPKNLTDRVLVTPIPDWKPDPTHPTQAPNHCPGCCLRCLGCRSQTRPVHSAGWSLVPESNSAPVYVVGTRCSGAPPQPRDPGSPAWDWIWWRHGPLSRYIKLQVAHAPGMLGSVFLHHRGLTIPTCLTARVWRTCHDACRGR